jgi:hypothetical protein
MQILFIAVLIARLHYFPIGTSRRFGVPHTRNDKSTFAAALLENLTAIAHHTRGRHPLSGISCHIVLMGILRPSHASG